MKKINKATLFVCSIFVLTVVYFGVSNSAWYSEKRKAIVELEEAKKLHGGARTLRLMGLYKEAEIDLLRCLEIREKILGYDDALVALTLNDLAAMYLNIGNYADAEPLLKKSASIHENLFGRNHIKVANILHNLATLYGHTSNYDEAEKLYFRSLKIKGEAEGIENPELSVTLFMIARLYYYMGRYDDAHHFFKRALRLCENNFLYKFQENEIIKGLIALYTDMTLYTEAEQLVGKILDREESELNKKFPDPRVVSTRCIIASFYEAVGKNTEALEFYKQCLDIEEKVFGIENGQAAITLRNLSILETVLGNTQESLRLIIRAQAIDEAIIERVSGLTTVERAMQYLTTLEGGKDVLLTLVFKELKKDDAARKEAYKVWLRRKGVVLEAQRRMHQALLEAGDQEAAKVFEELSQTRTRIAQLSFAGPGRESPEVYQKKLKDLNVQREELESKLSRLSQAYAQAGKVRKVSVEEVAKALPQGAVLVDFARIDVFNFEAKGKEKEWLPAHYLAFVLQPGQGQNVALIDLGPAAPIDQTISQINYAVNELKKAETEKQVEVAIREINRKLQEISRKLHDQVFAPLEKEIGGAQRVFLSPDGALNLLPFEILKDPNGKYLLEKYTFNYLAAGRDLVGFSDKKASTEKPLLLGDPDFNLDPKQKNQALNRLGMRPDTTVVAARSADLRNLVFKPLDKTRDEVNAISGLIGQSRCEVFLGESALEEVLQSRKAPRILHLATHGFFLTDQEWSAMGDFRGIGGTVSFVSMEQPFARPLGPKVNLENPLLRSGIALAGANRAGSSGQGSDGILTADEVLGLRLRGTELVVLSACETGLGEVKTGEGVFGLRRAFAQAGARSMVMSMWSVPDRETQELMVEFYKNILSGKLDRCQALRQAALTQKKVVQQRYGQDNPFFWGAFVFLGQAD